MKHENVEDWGTMIASFIDPSPASVNLFDPEPFAKKAIAAAARVAVISNGSSSDGATVDGPDIRMSVAGFYGRVLPEAGRYCLVSKRMLHYWYDTQDELVAATIAKTQTGADWYFGTNGYDDTEGRKKTNVIAARSLRIDIDAGAAKFAKHGPRVYEALGGAMRHFAAFETWSGLKASIIVKSGSGLHLYYTLPNDITDMGEWLRASTTLERLAQKFGLRIDTTVTKDEARILRPVGSLHNNGNIVHVIRDGDDITLEDLYACAERADAVTEIDAPVRVSKASSDGVGDADHPPAPTHDQVTAACPSLAAQVDSGFDGYEAFETGLAAARHTHNKEATSVVWFGNHPEFDKAAVMAKMHTFTGPPPTCKTIEGKLGSDAKCGTCKWKGKASTPIHAAQKQAGQDRAAAGAATATGPELTPEQQVVMDKINKGYFLAPEDLEYQIFADQSDAAVGVPRIKPVPEASMRLQWANKSVPVLQKDGSVKLVPAVSWWKASQQRREYSAGIGLRFDGKDDPNFFNLWKGFAVGPNRSSARLFLRHIRYVCGRNSEQFKYLVQWMAFCIQNPGKRAETVVALRGPEGSGKGSIGRILTALFGTHALHISNGRHLTGNFNAHLRTALLMFIDEGYWAGDPAAEGVLKSLITEDQILIEQKGVDARMADNMLSMIMASNNDWLVPAGPQARRYFVVDVPDTLCNNWGYWERLNEWLDNGGRGAILGFLQRLDLSKFNIRKIPNTAALDDQKRLSLPPFMKWLESQLYVGSLDGTSDGGAWKSEVTCSAVIRNYAEYCATQGRRYEATDAKTVSMKLGEVFGKLRRTRQLGCGTHRPYAWSVPALAEARAKFCTAAGIGTIAWPEED